MSFDFSTGTFHVLRHTCYLKDWLLISARGHDVCMRLVLDAFYGGTLGTNDQSHHAIRNSYLNCYLAGNVGWRTRWSAVQTAQEIVFPGCANLGEVLGSRQDLSLRLGYVFFATGHHEHWFFPAHRGLDVCVCFRTQSLDLAT